MSSNSSKFSVPAAGTFRWVVVSMLAALTGISMAAQATITLSNLAQPYNGSPRVVGVTAAPTVTSFIITYGGSTTPPTNVGSYPVVVTVVDPELTGTATGTLVISKANQSITLGPLAAKTYGDAPFTATAISSSGLAILEWESSDPSVASVSPSGLVTILGAGQTSIIAISDGNTNYNATWTAAPLNVARSSAPLPSGTQVLTYNATAQGLDPSTLPSGLASEITYRDTSVVEPTATPQVVFQNGPDTLDLSYLSTGMQAKGFWGLAKYITLAGTARKLHSCDVTLVSWARYDTSVPSGSLPWAIANPSLVVPPQPGISIPGNSGGFYHPVTLAFYDYENTGGVETYRLLTSQTVQALVPWRPVTRADGTAYPHNGHAFRVPFSFTDGVVLPPDVWVAVSFNTNTQGTAPIGVPGPYDALNISQPSGLQAGTDRFLSFTLIHDDWRWQNSTGSGGPMLRLRTTPTSATRDVAINAATYEVRSKASAFGADPWSTSALVITKAPYVANLTSLIQVRDGSPKPVIVTTTPGGINTSVTYAGSAVIPSALGTYSVTATSASPNYEGQVNGTLQIGDSFTAWRNATFAGSGLPPEQITDAADPDRDGLSNLIEYASNLNPLAGNHPTPVGFEPSGSNFAFTYRQNLHALDLNYAIQGTTSLNSALSWDSVTPLGEMIVTDDGSTRVVRATVAKPAGQSSYFLRLKTQR